MYTQTFVVAEGYLLVSLMGDGFWQGPHQMGTSRSHIFPNSASWICQNNIKYYKIGKQNF